MFRPSVALAGAVLIDSMDCQSCPAPLAPPDHLALAHPAAADLAQAAAHSVVVRVVQLDAAALGRVFVCSFDSP